MIFDVPMLEARFVTLEQGTGIVHCAPSHGPDDFNYALSIVYNLNIQLITLAITLRRFLFF